MDNAEANDAARCSEHRDFSSLWDIVGRDMHEQGSNERLYGTHEPVYIQGERPSRV